MARKRETALQRWGKEFARAREAAGFSQVTLAQHPDVHVSAQLISHWETGRKMPKITDRRAGEVRDLDDCEMALGTNGYLKRLLLEWVSPENSPEWSEWMAVEEDATELTSYQTVLIPGLLQCRSYAQAVLPSEDKVEERLERQRIFDQENAPVFEALLDESVLYRKVGSPEIMREALAHLMKMASRDDIIVRIVPFSANIKRFAHAFVIAAVDSGKQVALIDDARTNRIEERPSEIAELRRMWIHFGAAALSQEDSIDLIQRAIDERWPTP